MLAKNESAQKLIKDSWRSSKKIYHAFVEGIPEPSQPTLTHYLTEDERLLVHASEIPDRDAIKATLSYEILNCRDLRSIIGHRAWRVPVRSAIWKPSKLTFVLMDAQQFDDRKPETLKLRPQTSHWTILMKR